MNNGYQFIRRCNGFIPSGIAVQEGNYAYVNPTTSKRVTIRELIQFAEKYLVVDYMFWSRQEPYYTQGLLPLMKAMR